MATAGGKVATAEGKVTTAGGKVATAEGKVATGGRKVATAGRKVLSLIGHYMRQRLWEALKPFSTDDTPRAKCGTFNSSKIGEKS